MDKNIYINKEYKIENDRILSTANRFIHNYYGQFLYTDKIVNSNFSLNASLPYEVLDDGKRKLRFGNYKNIAEINFETNNKVIKFSGLNRKNIEKTIEDETNKKLSKSEKLLFQASQDKFSQIPAASVFYMPIKEIIMGIHDYGSMKIADNKPNSKIIRYANFLKNLEIIKINYSNNIYEFSVGETYKSIEKNSKNPAMDIFNYSINMGYEYLYSIGIKSLSSYIKISNSFYHNVINLRKNTEIGIKNLNEYYNNLYHSNMADYKFNVYIDTLADVKIINKKDNVITGDEHITNEIINKNL